MANAQWNTQFVDDSGNAGRFTAIDHDSSGLPHILYQNATTGELLYAVWNGTGGWSIELVTTSNGGGCALVIDEFDQSHAVFRHGYGIKYAVRSPSGQWGALESIVINTGTGLDPIEVDLEVKYDSFWDTMVPHVAYAGEADLRYAFKSPETSSWVTETVDDSYQAGQHASIAVDDAGRVYISYYDQGGTNLKFAHYNGLAWGTFIVDGITTAVGTYTSLVLDGSGTPHITYYDETNGRLKHATIDLGLVPAARGNVKPAEPATSESRIPGEN